jgi:hypothetical protein
LEIYNKTPGDRSEDSFSKAFIGGPNFREMQRKNIRNGGFQ